MDKPEPAPRWYQPWRRAEAPVPRDPADLGTCFGLEASLEAQPAPNSDTAPPAQRAGWMQRLAWRRRPSY